MFRRTVAITLVVTTTWITMWSAAPGFAQTDELKQLEPQQVIDRFEKALLLLDQLQQGTDRSVFDLEALVEKSNHEAEEIITLVKEGIRFEPYVGVLRGAKGTLMSQAGNSLDQSILLARLLKDAGYEATIGRAQLSVDQANHLIGQLLLPPRPRKGTSSEVEKMTEAVSEVVDQLFVEELSGSTFDLSDIVQQSNTNEKEMRRRIEKESEFLISTLHKHNGWPLKDSNSTEDLIQEATDYFWVQWRQGPGPWIDAHPTLKDQPEWASELQPTETFADAVPESLLHQFEFQVIIEQKIGDRLEQRPLLQPWRRPVANLVAKPMQFMNVPNTLAASKAGENLATKLESATLYIPYFSPLADTPAEPFDRNGNSVSIDALTSAATGLFQQFGEKTESAAAALGGLGGTSAESPDDLVAISALWIEVSTIAPNGVRKSTRRTVLDRVSPSDRAVGIPRLTGDLELKKKLTTFTFMLNPGWIPPTFVMDHAIELTRLRILNSLSVIRSKTDPSSSDLNNLWGGDKEDQLLLLSTLSNFDQYVDPGIYTFRSEPSLFSIERHLNSDLKISVMADIVWNSRRSFDSRSGSLSSSPDESLRMGVAETGLEGASYPWTGPIRHFSAFEFLESARSRNLPFRIIDRSNPGLLETLPLTAARRADLEQEISDGYVVLVPVSKEYADTEEIAWWRINTDTGVTLGVGPGRRGVDLAEYLVFSVLVGGLIGAVTMFGCMLVGYWLIPSARAYLNMSHFCGVAYTCAGIGYSVGSSGGPALIAWGGGAPAGWIGLLVALGVAGGGSAIAVTGLLVCL